jgi:hypothetical protein
MGGSEATNSGVRDPMDFLTSNSMSQPQISPFSNSRPLNLNLSEEEKLAMSKQIRDIFDSEPADEDQVMGEDDDEDEEEYDGVHLEDQQRRTEKLKTVLSPIAQLWYSGSEHIDLVTERLADGSRESKSNNFQKSFFDVYCLASTLFPLTSKNLDSYLCYDPTAATRHFLFICGPQ